MSTRCTISYSDDFHLYEECFDTKNVYLHLESGDWDAGLETATIDWRGGESTRPTLHVRMNVDLWRQIVEGWVKSHWGQDPSRDHKKIEFDKERIDSWLSKLPKKKDSEEEIEKKETPDDEQSS